MLQNRTNHGIRSSQNTTTQIRTSLLTWNEEQKSLGLETISPSAYQITFYSRNIVIDIVWYHYRRLIISQWIWIVLPMTLMMLSCTFCLSLVAKSWSHQCPTMRIRFFFSKSSLRMTFTLGSPPLMKFLSWYSSIWYFLFHLACSWSLGVWIW